MIHKMGKNNFFWKKIKKKIFFEKDLFVKKYLALVKKWWYIIKWACLEYKKTYSKNQKYLSFTLSETNYFSHSASGHPVSHSNIFQNIPFFIEFPGCRPMFLRIAVNKLLAHFVPKLNSTVIFPLFLLRMRNVGGVAAQTS